MKPKIIPFSELKIGDKVVINGKISRDDVQKFAKLTGDFNPLHLDEVYAATTIFKKTIPPGMLLGSLFSTLVGMHLPGKNCLYLAQTLQFRNPAPMDGKITISGEIIEKVDSLKILIILTKIHDNENNLLIEGEARIKVLE